MTTTSDLTMTTPDTTEFERAVLLCKRRVWLDSNDKEIERLQEAVSIACGLLNVDEDAITEAAEEWAEKKGLT